MHDVKLKNIFTLQKSNAGMMKSFTYQGRTIPSESLPFNPGRYRAVASWSRVQGTRVPTATAVEIMAIWLLSILLAVPEAIGFNMVTFDHNNVSITTCMLQPRSPFMTVSVYSAGMRVGVYTSATEFVKVCGVVCLC